jgi:Putative metallopeptidase
VPIMGREEDAADQFAAYLLLQFAKDDARRLILGVAYAYNVDASKPVPPKKNPFADEHGLPAQRFYNVLCMAYGAIRSCSPMWWKRIICPRNERTAAKASTTRFLQQ